MQYQLCLRPEAPRFAGTSNDTELEKLKKRLQLAMQLQYQLCLRPEAPRSAAQSRYRAGPGPVQGGGCSPLQGV
jgi:hypothetical protein